MSQLLWPIVSFGDHWPVNFCNLASLSNIFLQLRQLFKGLRVTNHKDRASNPLFVIAKKFFMRGAKKLEGWLSWLNTPLASNGAGDTPAAYTFIQQTCYHFNWICCSVPGLQLNVSSMRVSFHLQGSFSMSGELHVTITDCCWLSDDSWPSLHE